jgi:hypothetical protein
MTLSSQIVLKNDVYSLRLFVLIKGPARSANRKRWLDLTFSSES